LTYVGVTNIGESLLLPPPFSVKLIKNEDAPADGFTGVFPLLNDIGFITKIRVYDKRRKLCFDGLVDEQKKSRGKVSYFSINARSRAAVLLDNEALPQTYISPSLGTIFDRHVKPYGFTDYLGDEHSFNGELTITKGMSEWQAAEKFCRDFLKIKPRILGNKFDAEEKKPKGKLIFDNCGGIEYSSVSIQNKYYSVISEILGKSKGSDLYTTAAKNGKAEELGIVRKRFLNTVKGNPDNFIRNSQKKAFCAVVECFKEAEGELFMDAEIRDKQFGNIKRLYVSQMEYKLSSGGEMSRYVLRRCE